MDFENEVFQWENDGAEPSDEIKKNGFSTGYKPPAGIFNRFFSRVSKAIKELQTKFGSHAENRTNPHGVTAEQVGLDKVNNTSDSEKSVRFASEAGTARKTNHAMVVRFNGGSTEGTDKWTFDGSTGRSVNITPAKIGASEKGHMHTLDTVGETPSKRFNRIVVATKGADTTVGSTTQNNYSATVDGITELHNGLEITIIPDANSTSNLINLNVNGLGAISLRQPLSFTTFVATAPTRDGFLYGNTPCRLMYHANYVSGGIWLMADKQKTSAQDLYGAVPVSNGGTGHNSVDDVPTQGSTKMVTSGGVFNSLVQGVGFNSSYNEEFDGYSLLGLQLPTGKSITDIFAIVFSYSFGSPYLNGLTITPTNDGGVSLNVSGVKTNANSAVIIEGRAFIKLEEEQLVIRLSLHSFDIGTGETTLITPSLVAGRVYFK